MKNNQTLYQLDKNNYLPTFNRIPVVLDKGKGASVWDVEGNEYLDLLAGIAVNNVGHCHPKVTQAIQKQAEKLIHISNIFASEPQILLTSKIKKITGLDRVFMTNSGAESVEAALKVARKYAHSKGRGGDILTLEGAFHGRTLATIAAGSKAMQEGFEPLPSGFIKIPKHDLAALQGHITPNLAAIILEPIQGEGGIHVLDSEYLIEIRKICDEQNIVLIFDEIQSGMGRTGKWFAKDFVGIQPDIITLAKGLGGGVPIGAIAANEKVSEAMKIGNHGTTFGGNPLVCAAAVATIEVIEEENLLENAHDLGIWLRKELETLLPKPLAVRGRGLMVGVEFPFETKPFVLELIKKGLIANATALKVLRLVPPLNITKMDLEKALHIIQETLQDYDSKKSQT